MTVDTKFDVGEFVYMLYENKVKNVAISSILIEVKREVTTMYSVEVFYGPSQKVDEKDLYKTKKEAVQEMVRRAGYKVCKDDLKEM